jgi:hypothetical protein
MAPIFSINLFTGFRSKNQRSFFSVDGKNVFRLPKNLSFPINSFSDKAIGKAQLYVAQTSFV